MASLAKISVGVALAWCFLLSVACTPTPPQPGKRTCDATQLQQADHLQASPVLKDTPEGVNLRQESRVLPCDDDDGVGSVGWNGVMSFTGEDAVREHYRSTLAGAGWVVRGESESGPPADNQLDLGRPQLCFQSDNEPEVVLVIFIVRAPRDRQTQMFVEFHFGPQPQSCARYFM